MSTQKFIPPIHSGEILKEEFLDSMGLSQRAFARRIDVPANRVNQIVRGQRAITGNTAIQFGLALSTSPEMWLRLQARCELEKAQDESEPDLQQKIKPVTACTLNSCGTSSLLRTCKVSCQLTQLLIADTAA